MYMLSSELKTLPIISLQTGEAVAWARDPILAIANLEIMALHCERSSDKLPLILMARDIRQLATDCIIIDSEDELSEPGDIVRLRAMLDASYNPLDKNVVSDTGRKLGCVEDYSINLETSRVQKLHVRQSILKAWIGATLIIDRTQIIDIAPRQIIVRDATVRSPIMAAEPVPETPST